MPRIEGLTIEIGVDAKKFASGIKSLDKSIAKTGTSLKQVNRALHFNPASTDLIKQKQQLLGRQINDTKTKLKALKAEEDRLKSADGFDENSEDAQRLRREIIETESKLKSLNKQASKVSSVFGVQMKVAGEKMQALGRSISKTGDMLTRRLTMPIVAMAGVAAKKFAEVDKTMQLTNATMGNTEAEAKQVSDAMKDAAANSTFGMKDAAQASLNFARAGLNAAQAASTLAPAMNLAAGEGGNLDTVSGGLVATINGFHDSFDSAAKYADVFANACNNSALDIDSLSSSMSIAAPVFSAAGYAVQDAALYMGVMANNGIPATKAANSLKTGLARLVKPTDEAAGYMKKLGINITNSDGSMKSSIEVQAQLHEAFKDLSKSEKIAAASAIFGKNQFSPWLALIESAPSDVNKLAKSLEVEGTTAEMAEAMMSGFGGSMEKLKSSIDVAATSLGEALAPTIRKVSDKIQEAVDKFNELDEEEQQSIVKIGLMVAAAGPLLAIGGRLITGIGTMTKGLGTLMNTIKALGMGTATLGTAFGVAAGAALAFVGVAYAVSKATQAQLEKETAFNKEQKAHFKTLEDTTKAYKEAAAARDSNVQQIEGEFGLVENLRSEYNGLVDSNGKVKKGYEARAEYIKGELAEALGMEKKDLEELIDKNGKLKGKIDDVIAAQKAQAVLEANKDLYTQALKDQKEAAEKLGPALKDLEDKKKQEAEAEKRYHELQQEYNNQEARGRVTKATTDELEQARAKWYALNDEVAKGEKTVQGYTKTLSDTKSEIDRYEGLTKAIADKDKAAIQQWTAEWTEGIKTRKTATQDELTEQAKVIEKEYKAIEAAYKSGDMGITKDVVEQAKKRRDAANKEAGITAKDMESNAEKEAKAAAKGTKKGTKEAEKAYSDLANNSKKKLDNMEKSVSKSMKSAGDSASSGAAKIKKSFPVKLGKAVSGSYTLPDIWASIESVGKGVAKALFPKFFSTTKTKYFAKAYDNPLLFTSPSLYGGAVFGDRGSHAGGEMVYGKENLMNDIRAAVAGTGITINMTVNGVNDPRQIANDVIREIEIATRAM